MTIRTVSDIIRRIAHRCGRSIRQLKGTAPDIEKLTQASANTIKIEWGFDLDTITTEGSDWVGNLRKARLKGRCATCWGSLVGRLNDDGQITGIKCRVCGKKLEGDAARDEYARLESEWGSNDLNSMISGSLPCYADDATFVLKTIPIREPVDKDQLALRVAQAKATPNKNGQQLTRHDFPPGSPGFFVLQATILMASVEDVSHSQAWSIVDLPHVRFRDDGTAVFTLSTSGVSDDLNLKNAASLAEWARRCPRR